MKKTTDRLEPFTHFRATGRMVLLKEYVTKEVADDSFTKLEKLADILPGDHMTVVREVPGHVRRGEFFRQAFVIVGDTAGYIIWYSTIDKFPFEQLTESEMASGED